MICEKLHKEIVKNGAEKVLIATDYFDASINRIAAWTNGMRSLEKALLYANLQPNAEFIKLQEERDFTKLMSLSEAIKVMPFGDIWDYYCEQQGVLPEIQWYEDCESYEKEVLSTR